MKLSKLRLSPETVIALVALFVALGGAGVAATGGNFILGQANDASSKTSLTAGINDRALLITNANTGSSAAGLSLNVAPGHAPIVVNPTAGKATNLSADKLDGIDSSGFVQGSGKSNSAVLVLPEIFNPNPPPESNLLAVPGFGTFRAQCAFPGAKYGVIGFRNDSGTTLDLTVEQMRQENGSTESSAFSDLVANTAEPQVIGHDFDLDDADTATWQLSRGLSGAALVTAFTSIMFDGSNNCVFRVSYIRNG
jgi:hypothetical protein